MNVITSILYLYSSFQDRSSLHLLRLNWWILEDTHSFQRRILANCGRWLQVVFEIATSSSYRNQASLKSLSSEFLWTAIQWTTVAERWGEMAMKIKLQTPLIELCYQDKNIEVIWCLVRERIFSDLILNEWMWLHGYCINTSLTLVTETVITSQS